MTNVERALIGAMFLLANAVLLLWVDSVGAQEEEVEVQALELQVDKVDSSEYPIIDLVVRTPSEFADAPPGAIEFGLASEGETPDVEVTRVTAENLEVVLLLDTSGSMAGSALANAKEASRSFVDGLPASSRIAVVGFGSEPNVAVDFTSDRGAVLDAVDGLVARGETAVYDAVVEGASLFERSVDTQQFIVLLTDGGDTVSTASLSEALGTVGVGGVPVVAVSLQTAESDPASLQLLAGAAKGEFVEAADPAAVEAAFDQIASSISTSYAIRFETAAEGLSDFEINARWNDVVATAGFSARLPVAVVPTPSTTPPPSSTVVAPTTTVASEASVAAGPEAVTISVDQPAWLLLLGAAAMGMFMVIAFSYLFWPRRKKRKPLIFGDRPSAGSMGSALSSSASRITSAVGAVLDRDEDQSAIVLRLEQAGIAMRPAEAMTVLVLGMVASFLFGLVFSFVAALLLPVLFAVSAFLFVSIKGSIRKRNFQKQLPSTLQMMGGSLRTGYSLVQVADVIAREALPPTSEEFARVVVENRLGRDLTASFEDMAKRVDSEDFPWVVDAIDISRSIGGDLGEVLDTVAKTVRDREEVRREIKTLSAEGRMSAGVMVSLPFVMMGMLTIINPGYLAELYTTGNGRLLSLIGITLLLTGTYWMSRIVRLKY